MVVKLWNFAKRANSTLQPVAVADAEYDCIVVNGSGILSPTIKINTANANPVALTYAYIADYGRYYFVSNWRYTAGLWYCDLSVDVLASYKSVIGSSTKYIARSSYAFNGRLKDNKYPIIAGMEFSAKTQNVNPFAKEFNSGSFVVGVINNDSNGMGAVTYYVFTSAQFRSFAAILLGDSSYIGTIADISEELLKCLVNPFQYIASCVWLPITVPTSGTVSSIKLGWWSITANASLLSGYTRASGTVTIAIPKHPDAATRGMFLLCEPFTQYYLDFPPFGSLSIPAAAVVDASYIDFAWSVDCITGVGKLSIGAENSAEPFNIIHGQVGVPVQLAQLAPDIMGAMNQMPASGIPLWDNITKAAGFVTNAILTTLSPMQSTGNNGGFMAGYYPIRLTGMFAKLADENNADFGRPLCEFRKISDIPGYIECADADISISCTEEERSTITGYLTGGFFYE